MKCGKWFHRKSQKTKRGRLHRAAPVFALLCGLLLSGCGAGEDDADALAAEETQEPAYSWEETVDTGDFYHQVCRVEDGIDCFAESEEETMPLPENYRAVGSPYADSSVTIFEVTEEDGSVTYQVYCEQGLYQADEDEPGLSHRVAVRRGFCGIVFLPEEIETSETLSCDYESLAGSIEYPVIAETSGNGYDFHYALTGSFVSYPEDERLMALQGIDQDILDSAEAE